MDAPVKTAMSEKEYIEEVLHIIDSIPVHLPRFSNVVIEDLLCQLQQIDAGVSWGDAVALFLIASLDEYGGRVAFEEWSDQVTGNAVSFPFYAKLRARIQTDMDAVASITTTPSGETVPFYFLLNEQRRSGVAGDAEVLGDGDDDKNEDEDDDDDDDENGDEEGAGVLEEGGGILEDIGVYMETLNQILVALARYDVNDRYNLCTNLVLRGPPSFAHDTRHAVCAFLGHHSDAWVDAYVRAMRFRETDVRRARELVRNDASILAKAIHSLHESAIPVSFVRMFAERYAKGVSRGDGGGGSDDDAKELMRKAFVFLSHDPVELWQIFGWPCTPRDRRMMTELAREGLDMSIKEAVQFTLGQLVYIRPNTK